MVRIINPLKPRGPRWSRVQNAHVLRVHCAFSRTSALPSQLDRIYRTTLVLLFTLLSISTAHAAEFTASVDRKQLQLNEPVLFTLSLSNSDTRLRAEGVDANVDLSRLGKDFNLGRPEASSNYNIYLGQGRSTSEIKVELFPKHTGKLSIPVFEIDGLKSNSITIEVLKKAANAAEEVFVRSGTNQTSAWVGQQVVAWVDLYHRVELASASLGSNLETEPQQIELLPNWKMPQESRKEKHQGIEYDVERMTWSVFPSQAGPFTVQLPDIWVATKSGNKLRLPHQRLSLEIKALPAELPADIIIGKPELSAEPLPNDFKQYELSQWIVTLKAPVAVTTLPRLLPGIDLPEGLKLYPDSARYHTQQNSNGIMDAADYSLSIMPLRDGEFELPTIRVPYFDPDTGRAALVELPGQTIKVTANAIPQPAAITDSNTVSDIESTTAQTKPEWLWQFATAIMTLLWLTTLLKLWRKQNRQPARTEHIETTALKTKDTRHPLQQKLLQAMGSQTLEQGLQQWSAQQADDVTVPEAVRALQRFCYGGEKESEAEIKNKVEQAITRIRQTPIKAAANEARPWLAESFYQANENKP